MNQQPTNAQDAAAGNENAIRHIAYAEGYAAGKASAEETPAKQERLTEAELEHALGPGPHAAGLISAIESACAKKWGVTLE